MRVDESAAGMDLGLAAQRRDVAPADHRRFEDDPAEPQLADMDVEVGQDRPLPLGLAKLRPAQHVDVLRDEAVDDQLLADEASRPPVELDDRRLQEDALRIADLQVVDGQRAEQRAVDPPDAEGQPGIGRDPLQLAGDEAAARAGVERGEGEEAGDEQHADRDHRADQDAAQRAPVVGLGVGHQKACPIET